jgi:hypothetical protein
MGLTPNNLELNVGGGAASGKARFLDGSGLADGYVDIPIRTVNRRAVRWWSGSGSQLGMANAVTQISSNLTMTTPGTTNKLAIDLQALTDLGGNALSLAELCVLEVYNLPPGGISGTPTDGAHVVMSPGTTNGWTGPFLDQTTPTAGKFRIPPPAIGADGLIVVPFTVGGFNLSAYTVGATNKTVEFLAAGACQLRITIVGRTAST